MSQAPSMPMFWDAYLADTTHLTTEEHGAYLLLLAAMWRRNGSVPDDDKDNARIVGLSIGKWRKFKVRVAGLLTFENDEITQKKLQKTWKKIQETAQKNRENGAKGGRPRSKENNDLVKANGSVSDNPNETLHNQSNLTDKKEPNGSSKVTSSKKGSRLPEDWVLPLSLGQYAIDQGLNELQVRREAEKFRDYWISVPGAKGVKLDWDATWRNWVRKAADHQKTNFRQQRQTEAESFWLQ